MEIVSFARFGYEGEIIKVEADLRRGIPAIDIVGLPDGAVREARERMRAAIRNSALDFPRERILINLSPADLKKEGSGFDLPIALAVLGAAEQTGRASEPDLPADDSSAGAGSPNGNRRASTVMVLGELELSGAVRAVRGVLSAVSLGLEQGIRWYIVPKQNQAEASIRKEAGIIGVSTLSEAVQRLKELSADHAAKQAATARQARGPVSGGIAGQAADSLPTGRARAGTYAVTWPERPACQTDNSSPETGGYEEVRGQNRLVRALEIAAAGGHHLIAYGPPGCGKTLALRRFPSLLPELDEATAVTVTRIYSIAGSAFPGLGNTETGGAPATDGSLRRRAPFREPHQNASLEGMIGGGKNCRPGEISLAHGGVLFLDEAAQFRTSVLQSLRAPLETGTVTVSRAGKADTFPARFQLLMAVNPCPCGNFGAPDRVCTCAPDMIGRYWKKMTAPLLDRIDLRIAVQAPECGALIGKPGFSTEELRREIGAARILQWDRNGNNGRTGAGGEWQNAHLGPAEVERLCVLQSGVEELFVGCLEKGHLSGRGGHGILKVARTIADLEGSLSIQEDHLLEAVQFRRWDGMVPDFL